MQLADATILIVDDEEVICEIMTAWFARHARRVLSAGNGQQALKLLTESHVDVIVSDVRMPVMDGVALVRAIAAAGAERPLVILVTGFSDLQPRDAYALGVEAIIEKPLERDQLISEVKRGLTDRNELWSKPPALSPDDALAASPVCLAKFTSLADALRDGQIAFGRGGFCMKTPRKFREGPVQFRLEFQAEQKIISGVGMVRWNSAAENLLGIEVLYVDDPGRGWMAELAEAKKLEAYIPRAPALSLAHEATRADGAA
jgi:CheY-like chemotaxis protein